MAYLANQLASNTATGVKTPRVVDGLSAVRNEIDELEKALSTLSSRLSPVLSPMAVPGGAATGVPTPQQFTVYGALEEHRERILSANQTIKALLDALEI